LREMFGSWYSGESTCSCGSTKGKKWILKRGLGVGWKFWLMIHLGPCFSFLVQFHEQTRYGVLFILLIWGSSSRWDWDLPQRWLVG
jgi:hypothetical protein